MKDTVSVGSGLRFTIVGVLMTILYFVLFLVSHSVFGLEPIYATPVAYIPGIFMSYTLHRLWSFQTGVSVGKSLPRYLLLHCSCMVLTAISTELAYRLFSVDGLQISILTTLFAGVISFFVSALWVFPGDKNEPA